MSDQKTKIDWMEIPKVRTREQIEYDRKLNIKKFILYISFFRKYPDIFVDMIKPKSSSFNLHPFQRVIIRILARYQYVFATLTRGSSKSFTAALHRLLKGILYPGDKCRVVAGGTKEQGKKISSEKFKELFTFIPYLETEIVSKTDNSNKFEVLFKNKSSYEVIGCSEQTRGGRANTGIIEEAFDIDYTLFSQIVEPMFNIQRSTAAGFQDPNEFNEQLAFVTTAGYYDSPMNKHQLKLFKDIAKNKRYTGKGTSCVLGSSWELSVHFGLLDESKVKKETSEDSVSKITFDREYGSIWIDFSDKSYFNYEDVAKCRTIEIAELEADLTRDKDTIYWISYDAARSGGSQNDNAVAVVFKGIRLKNNIYQKNIVAMYTWHDDNENNTDAESIMHLGNQARDLKRLMNKYCAEALVVDAAGLGTGICDFLVIETYDEVTGETYPAYGVVSKNGEETKEVLPDNVEKKLHIIKANEELNNIMHNTLLGHLQSKRVRLLVDVSKAGSSILVDNDGESTYDYDAKLEHHIQTNEFINEMMSLETEIKNNKIKLVPPGKQRKDRFTAVEYGIWWCQKYLESKQVDDEEDSDLVSFLNSLNGKTIAINQSKTKNYFNK